MVGTQNLAFHVAQAPARPPPPPPLPRSSLSLRMGNIPSRRRRPGCFDSKPFEARDVCLCGGPEVGQVGEVQCDVTRAATSRPSPCNQPVTHDTTRRTRPRRTRGRGQEDRPSSTTQSTAAAALPVASSALPVPALLAGGARACSSCSLQFESSPPRQPRPACQRHTALHQTRVELDKASPDACWGDMCVLARANRVYVCMCARARVRVCHWHDVPEAATRCPTEIETSLARHPVLPISQWWTPLAVRLRCI